jgi:FixJ family two-component response regulator
MANGKDRILVVESNPVISDLLVRQTLLVQGYQVREVRDASAAIPQSVDFSPDLLIVNLHLPGLSGKDLLVALNAQGSTIPVIIIAQEGMQMDIIQAFRLGATDVLLWPMRDTEVITAVERALTQVRERREREHLARQLQQANQDLQQRVRELTTIAKVGKAVTPLVDQRHLFDKVVEAAVQVTQADMGWFMLRDDVLKSFILKAQRGLPPPLAPKLNLPWDDGISSLVAISGETLALHGDALIRFKTSSPDQFALITPVKVQNQVDGLLVVLRQVSRPFGRSEQNLLEAICDYVSIALMNLRLYRALEERAQTLQKATEHTKQESP